MPILLTTLGGGGCEQRVNGPTESTRKNIISSSSSSLLLWVRQKQTQHITRIACIPRKAQARASVKEKDTRERLGNLFFFVVPAYNFIIYLFFDGCPVWMAGGSNDTYPVIFLLNYIFSRISNT